MSTIGEDEAAMIARHKKEVKDLTGKITGMKKQATKSTRKNVMKQIKEMEDELKLRHERELKGLNGEGENSDEEITPEMLLAQLELEKKESLPVETPSQPTGEKKKRNRQKEKLAKREAEMKRIQEEAREEQADAVDYRGIELQHIEELCKLKKLVQHDIIPDGNCLFSSIADQLKIRQNIETNAQQLRIEASEYIKSHPDDFIPFLFDEESMSLKDIDQYTDKLVNTVMWGGDLELLALSKVFDCPISVMMSGRSELIMNEDGHNAELKLVYYKHVFGLGEHYNSLHDA